MFKTKWSLFAGKEKAVEKFANGESNFQDLIKDCEGDEDAQKEVRRLRKEVGANKDGLSTARKRAKNFLRRQLV